MKKLILAASAIAAMIGSNVLADASQSTSVTIGGSVTPTCIMTTPTFAAATNASSVLLVGPAGTSAVTIPNLADSATAALNSSDFKLTYSDSYCNYAHTVGIKATNGGLVDSGTGNDPVAGSGDFVRRIGYNSIVSWAGQDIDGPNPATSVSTDLGDATKTSAINTSIAGANRGALVLHVVVPSNPNPVIAGSYTETLTLKIGATL